MNKNGPIVVIEDDPDDRYLFEKVIRDASVSNEVVMFEDGPSALEYLKQTDIYPFLILSDVNLPKMDGFQIRKMVQTADGLEEKCVPYLLISTSVSPESVRKAYKMSVQGFFLKPNSIGELTSTLRLILDYWSICYAPR